VDYLSEHTIHLLRSHWNGQLFHEVIEALLGYLLAQVRIVEQEIG
jgi:hypothetical protein